MNNQNSDHWYWGKQILACFDDLQSELQQPDPPVVDREVIPSFTGSPDGICAWFICEKTADLKRLRLAEESLKSRIQSRMEVHDFPASAIAGFHVNSTSVEEIENAGGRFYFFR